MKIIIVDDEEEILYISQQVLSKLGHEVVTDQTGDLVKNMDHSKTGLVILDIDLGNNDGRFICRMLKVQDRTKDIPVILASASPELPATSMRYGADDFLPKPFGLSDLQGIVNKHLRAA